MEVGFGVVGNTNGVPVVGPLVGAFAEVESLAMLSSHNGAGI